LENNLTLTKSCPDIGVQYSDSAAFKDENNAMGGLLDSEMNPKPAYETLDQLINHEWKTSLVLKSDKDGLIRFRGFKGHSRLSWKDKSGKEQHSEFDLSEDGNGF